MDDHNLPADVAALAASVNGRPIAWRYGELGVTIVFEDGRKIVFPASAPTPASDPTPNPSPNEYIWRGGERRGRNGGKQG